MSEGTRVHARPQARWDVPTAADLRRLAGAPLPLRLDASTARRTFHRDLYFDTAERALEARGAACRFRLRADDRRELMVSLFRDGEEYERRDAEVATADPQEAFTGSSEPARVLRALVNPAALVLDVELEVERNVRIASAGWLRPTRVEMRFDLVTVRAGGLARTFHELVARELDAGHPGFDTVARAIGDEYGLRAVSTDKRTRAAQLRRALDSESLARAVAGGSWVIVLALDGMRVALIDDGEPRIPAAEGSGEEACRHLMRRVLGSAVGELHRLSTVHADARPRTLEVWVARRVELGEHLVGDVPVEWVPMAELLERAASAELVDAPSLAALTILRESELYPQLKASDRSDPRYGAREGSADQRTPARGIRTPDAAAAPPVPLLDAEVSFLEFNARVLALAVDRRLPLLERVRYLSIVSANLDEFFMVRVAGLKAGGEEVTAEGEGAPRGAARIERVARRAREIIADQYRAFEACRPELESAGVQLRRLDQLDERQRAELSAYFRSTIFAYLTPRAITLTPGHSMPIVPALSLCIAVVLRDARASGPRHFAEVAIPTELPRFISPAGGTVLVPIEEIIRPELPLLHRGRRIEGSHLFRVTRDAAVNVDVQQAGDLVQAMEAGALRRRTQPIVRIEVERAMPATLREQLLQELQLEPGSEPGALGESDEYEIPGLMDLAALREIADLPMPALRFAPFTGGSGIDTTRPLWDTLRERDALLHHPYDDFSATVVRLFEEAADDPDVASIRVTLYRAGERSRIVQALVRAAKAGKDVTAFVELKARFDEQRNVRWATQLENAGVHVVHAVLGVKNHAKVTLVVRREGDATRRYAHIGTGNYNADTARFYTDLGLMTSRASLCDDVNDLFNALTGSSVPTQQSYRECLVAPSGVLPGLLERIEREAEHARAGSGGRIRMKLNGLSDPEVVHALYRASQAGVEIDAVVRGICTLAPGVPGVSERIRVTSILGRFLEHARVIHFGGGGAPEYFIGSADLRPRNLRRRVEVLAPVHDPELRARLDRLLEMEIADPTAWELRAGGEYVRRTPAPGADTRSVQERMIERASSVGAPPATASIPAVPA